MWLKNGKKIGLNTKAKIIEDEIELYSVNKEDQGSYQCLAYNKFDVVAAQASSVVLLDEIRPQMNYKFIDQTMQPGPSVSLKCSGETSRDNDLRFLKLLLSFFSTQLSEFQHLSSHGLLMEYRWSREDSINF